MFCFNRITLAAMLKNDFREQGIHKHGNLLEANAIIQMRVDSGSDKGGGWAVNILIF